MPTKYYPRLSSIVRIEHLPEQLNFLQGGINTVFDNLGFRNLRVNRSLSGDAVSYELDIISYKELKFDIPGTGFALSLNPEGATGMTAIPISVTHSWGIKRYLKNFKLETFPYTPEAFLNLAFTIFNLTDQNLVAITAANFISSANQLNDLATTLHDDYGLNITLPVNNNPEIAINDIVAAAEATAGFNLKTSISTEYILDPNPEVTLSNVEKLFSLSTGGNAIDKIKDLFIPKVSARLVLTAGLEFPRDVLMPVDQTTFEPVAGNTALLFAESEFTFSTQGGIGFDTDVTLSLTPALSQIGNTGLLIGFTGAKLDFSRNTNIPEATADGRPNDFIGVYIQDAEIYLPKKWFGDQGAPSIFGHNLLIGTGGISGTIGIDGGNVLNRQIGNFILELDTFDITFHQNAITHSHIHGNIEIPGFKNSAGQNAKIDLDGAISENGDFHITAATNVPLPAIKIPNVLEINLKSFEFGREDDRFYVEVAGILDFLWNIPAIGNVLPKAVEIKKLRIWEDGKLEFALGGVSLLPKPITLPLGPVKLTISSLTIGSHEQEHDGAMRKYAVVGFDGGVNVNPGGVDVRANGVKLYFTVDGGSEHIFLRIQGIKIDIRISSSDSESTAKVLLSGWLSIKEPDPGVDSDAGDEFAGGISIRLNKLGISGSASMRLRPKVPAFIVDLGLEISNAIPLGSTGLGIYGFRGLIGKSYVADRTTIPGLTDASPWWQYYKGKIPEDYLEGIQVSKFKQRSGFALGAGVSLATQSDKGKVFSSKLFFLLSLPDVFLLQGQAAILKKRIQLTDTTDPPFFALLAITSHSIEVAFGVNYKIPEESGAIADINGLLEMGFFWGDNAAWYLNIGKETPEEQRVRAKLLSIFNVYFYFMINSQGIRAGAGASWKFKKSLGPVGIDAGAYIDTAGRISFHPKQIGGYISMGGYLKIKVFKFKFGFTLDASLSGEAPKPFLVTGSFHLKINLPWPFKDIKITVELTWAFNNDLFKDPLPVIDSGNNPSTALNVHTKEAFQLKIKEGSLDFVDITDDYIVPMDAFIDVEFLHGLLPSGSVTGKIGGVTAPGDHIELTSPQKAKSVQVRHEFDIAEINIQFYDGSHWTEYNVFEAATALHDVALFPHNNLTGWWTNYKQGFFQLDKPKRYNKIRVLAQTPFSYFSQAAQTIIPEELHLTTESMYCAADPIGLACVDFEKKSLDGQPIPNNYSYQPLTFYGLMPLTAKQYGGMVFYITVPAGSTVIALEAPVIAAAAFTYTKGLAIAPENILEIYLPTSCAIVKLYLSTGAVNATIKFYQLVDVTPIVNPPPVPVFDYIQIGSTQTVTQANLLTAPVTFIYNPSHPNEKVDKVVIIASTGSQAGTISCDPVLPEAAAIERLLNQIAATGYFIHPLAEFYPLLNAMFSTYFHKTVLYGIPSIGTVINYEITYKSTQILMFRVYDNNGFSCEFRLEMITTEWMPFSFDMIVNISGLVPDPAVTVHGSNYGFIVNATLNNGKHATLRGTSGFPIKKCYDLLSTKLHDICYQSYDDFIIDSNIPSATTLQDDYNNMVDGLNNTVQPMWRPNTFFRIKMIVNDKVSYGSALATTPTTVYAGFKTKGPIGQFHQWKDTPGSITFNCHPKYQELKDQDKELEFKLAGLMHYIDYSKSYPNADGNILNAKPLFYKNPRLLLFYVQPYVVMFFKNWDNYKPASGSNYTHSSLEVVIKDPQESDPSNPNPVLPLDPVTATWQEGGDLQMTNEIQTLHNFSINGHPCIDVSKSINLKQDIYSVFQLGDGIDQYLKPMKLYHALFNLITDYAGQGPIPATVHKYAFQTSRYRNFEEQVQSWILSSDAGNERYATFTILKDFVQNGDFTKCQQIIDNTLDPLDALSVNYGDKFDRLLDGALVLGALEAPVTTEFNIIRDSVSNAYLGILIRNPEPFNDPKLPDNILTGPHGALRISFTSPGGGGEEKGPQPVILYSKDRSRIFVTYSGMTMASGTYEFTFVYFEYDGYEYAEIDTQTIILTLD